MGGGWVWADPPGGGVRAEWVVPQSIQHIILLKYFTSIILLKNISAIQCAEIFSVYFRKYTENLRTFSPKC